MNKRLLLTILLPFMLLAACSSTAPKKNISRIISPETLALVISIDAEQTDKTVYTIQTGTFNKLAGAEKYYSFLLKKNPGDETSHLRIEKINKYFTVRLGKFDGYTDAKALLQKLKEHYPDAFILEAHIKNKNIIMQKKKTLYIADNH